MDIRILIIIGAVLATVTVKTVISRRRKKKNAKKILAFIDFAMVIRIERPDGFERPCCVRLYLIDNDGKFDFEPAYIPGYEKAIDKKLDEFRHKILDAPGCPSDTKSEEGIYEFGWHMVRIKPSAYLHHVRPIDAE